MLSNTICMDMPLMGLRMLTMYPYQPVKKKSFDQREIRTRHEPIIDRILAKKCIYLLRMCIFFCTFAAQNTNTLSYEKDFRYFLRACQ